MLKEIGNFFKAIGRFIKKLFSSKKSIIRKSTDDAEQCRIVMEKILGMNLYFTHGRCHTRRYDYLKKTYRAFVFETAGSVKVLSIWSIDDQDVADFIVDPDLRNQDDPFAYFSPVIIEKIEKPRERGRGFAITPMEFDSEKEFQKYVNKKEEVIP